MQATACLPISNTQVFDIASQGGSFTLTALLPWRGEKYQNALFQTFPKQPTRSNLQKLHEGSMQLGVGGEHIPLIQIHSRTVQ